MGRILTNMAFFQSRTWREATESICGAEESPDRLAAWRQAWRLLRLRRKGGEVEAVVTMGPRASLAYGLACMAAGVESRQVLCEVFLDEARSESASWRAKTAAFRQVARRALGVIVNSTGERASVAERFGISPEKVVFLPLCTTVAEPRAVEAERPLAVVTAGRTARDLATYWAAARLLPDTEFVAIVGREQPLPEGERPANVSVVAECAWEEYLKRLGKAGVVALPLLPSGRSTGQVVLFEAMSLGKAVVTTRMTGTVDYVREGETGLLVEAGDVAGMAAALRRVLADEALRTRLGAAALAFARSELNPEVHARRRLEIVHRLAAAARQ